MGYMFDNIKESENNLKDITGNLESYSSSANSATTYDSYLAYKELYEQAFSNYTEEKLIYQEAIGVYERYITFTKAQTALVDVPDAKDKNQWLAGGALKAETFAGGMKWSPTDMPSFNLKPQVGKNSNLLAGNMLPFLGYGLGNIYKILSGGALNLMFDDDIRVTTTLRMSMTIYSSDGSVISTNDTDISSDGKSVTSDNQPNISYADSSMYLDNQWNLVGALQGGLQNGLPEFNLDSTAGVLKSIQGVSMVVNIYNMATNDSMNFEQKIGAGIAGSVIGAFSSLIGRAVIGALGIVSGSLLVNFAINALVAHFVSEGIKSAIKSTIESPTIGGFRELERQLDAQARERERTDSLGVYGRSVEAAQRNYIETLVGYGFSNQQINISREYFAELNRQDDRGFSNELTGDSEVDDALGLGVDGKTKVDFQGGTIGGSWNDSDDGDNDRDDYGNPNPANDPDGDGSWGL